MHTFASMPGCVVCSWLSIYVNGICMCECAWVEECVYIYVCMYISVYVRHRSFLYKTRLYAWSWYRTVWVRNSGLRRLKSYATATATATTDKTRLCCNITSVCVQYLTWTDWICFCELTSMRISLSQSRRLRHYLMVNVQPSSSSFRNSGSSDRYYTSKLINSVSVQLQSATCLLFIFITSYNSILADDGVM